MNLDLSQITAFALEGSCLTDAEVVAASTLTLPRVLRARGERSAASTAKIGLGSDAKAWPLRAAVRLSAGDALTLTF